MKFKKINGKNSSLIVIQQVEKSLEKKTMLEQKTVVIYKCVHFIFKKH
jgi:hypothetical protein